MGSILSKLFGGGNHHSHGNAQAPPPALPAPPPTQPSVSRSTSSTSKPTTPAIADGPPPLQPPIKPAPINILEVEVDEEAFKETSPPIYTSTIQAQIDPSPPHPLEQYTHKTQVHLTTVEAPQRQQAQTQAPIATLDSDYEEEVAQLSDNPEIEEAVIKIQAGVRGFLVRKQINASKSPSPSKSKSIDDPMSQQENILPPPENFDTSTGSAPKPILPSIKSKRVETPIPGSPFAQDDTDYTILDSVDPQETGEEAPLISNPEELEIFKKINEINQLLASNVDEEIEVVPEPPKALSSSTINTAISSASINNALNELDQTIREQEMTLPPEADDEVLVIEPAFAANNDNIVNPTSTQGPAVLVKAPSLEEEDPNAEPNTPSLSMESAAIRIQAAFRGYEVRKSLSREVSPARSVEEESKPERAVEPELKSQNAEPQPTVPDAGAKEESDEQKQSEPEATVSPQEYNTSEELAKPVQEEVAELSSQDIIEDFVPKADITVESEPQTETTDAAAAEPSQEPLVNVAIKEGFGTIASRAEEVVIAPSAIEEEKPPAPVLDIEKSIQELEKSFDRDLLADVASEVPAESTGQQQVGQQQEEASLISIEPPTPAVQVQVAPTFPSSEPLLPSKIPVLDRANKSILKEPSSPEPHTYTNLPLPSCASPLSDTTTSGREGGDDSDDETESSAPSPIPLRASSPSPFSKKRPRRHRGGKKK